MRPVLQNSAEGIMCLYFCTLSTRRDVLLTAARMSYVAVFILQTLHKCYKLYGGGAQEEKVVVKSGAELGGSAVTERVTHVNKDLDEAVAEAKGVRPMIYQRNMEGLKDS
jgi:hypothetical protein